MENNKKYTVIHSKLLASTLHYLGGFKYFIYDDNTEGKTKKSYSFEDTPEFRMALAKVHNVRNELRELNK